MTQPPVTDDPIAACAEMVRDGDPDRFLATMTGTVEQRKRLFVIYAFNLEIARAPYMTQEPMVAMIRLQFWRDVITAAVEGNEAPKHEVAQPLSQLLIWQDVEPAPLLRMLEARDGDAQGAPRQTFDQITAYARDTSGALMLASARATGVANFDADIDINPAVEALGEASGLANWFLAQPALRAAGRGHIAPDEALIVELAEHGLAQLQFARDTLPKRGNPALRTAWRSGALLKQARTSPARVLDGSLGESEALRRGALLLRTLSGRW